MKTTTRNTVRKTVAITAIAISTFAPAALLRGQQQAVQATPQTISAQNQINSTESQISNLETNILMLERSKAIATINNGINAASDKSVEALADEIDTKGVDNLRFDDRSVLYKTGYDMVIGMLAICVYSCISRSRRS